MTTKTKIVDIKSVAIEENKSDLMTHKSADEEAVVKHEEFKGPDSDTIRNIGQAEQNTVASAPDVPQANRPPSNYEPKLDPDNTEALMQTQKHTPGKALDATPQADLLNQTENFSKQDSKVMAFEQPIEQMEETPEGDFGVPPQREAEEPEPSQAEIAKQGIDAYLEKGCT